MHKAACFLYRFLRDREGATVIEFAVVAPVFFLLLMGIVEFGLYMFSSVVIEGITVSASRDASIGKTGGAGNRVDFIRAKILEKAAGLINGDTVEVTAGVVNAAAGTGGAAPSPDICLVNTARPTVGGPCPPCPGAGCQFEDVNGDNVYNGTVGATDLGGQNQLVEIRVMYPWKVQIPFMGRYFGENGVMMISSSTVVKNEPFGP